LLPASTIFANVYNETWTWAGGGREYAIIGSTMGTHFFDVTDTANVVEVGMVPGAAQGTDIIHRDYKHLDHYLYIVCDEGPSTLQIVDMSYLPGSLHVIYDSDALFRRAHNIFIDTAKRRLYTCSDTKGPGEFNALGIYSLDNPESPQLLAYWNDVGHVHDAYVRNDTGFCNSGYDGLWVMNFSNPANPQLITKITTYQEQGYNHSGWWSEDRRAYVFADETHGMRLKACLADDMSNFGIESLFGSVVDSNSIPHNVIIREHIAYVSYYHDGLWAFDISGLSDVKPIAHYDTYLLPDHDSYRGAWGVNPLLPSGLITISDMQTGLYVFAWEDTAAPVSTPQSDPLQPNFFPNPTTDHFEILVEQPGTLRLFDSHGRCVVSQGVSIGNNRVMLPETLPGGLYCLEVLSNNRTFASLLIKQ